MEATGLNVGYLMMQIVCLLLIGLVGVAIVVFIFNKVGGQAKELEFIDSLAVTDDGVVIPKQVLGQVSNVNLYKRGQEIILKPQDR